MSEKGRANRGPSAGPDNRRALIDAARAVFGESGFAAPLSAVARRAGVGQGSLYRHFPDRVALAVAVFDENIEELEALARGEDATLDTLFDAVTQQAMGSLALIDMITAAAEDARARHLRTRITAVIELILARDQDAGRIGRHVEVDDVLLSISMVSVLLPRSAPEERAAVTHRARTLFRAAFEPRAANGASDQDR
jgi:AcrR family transcriptional regulator